LAYLNLQYISKQDELENQISRFLLAIINIMVLMLAISTILAIVVSNRLTSPLKYIQESLNKVQFGSDNKAIEYEGTDEIGELVQEYNRKVAELQESATQLAKSERESAWREMAKQVAHEIKNPLTPMKLSIQHMKRSIQVKDEDSQIKLNRVTASLIEQIDALTKIANEFSNFAKMPKAVEEAVNLSTIVENAYAVFSESDEYQIELNNLVNDDAIIWSDKTLCLRVFNNLIKNALQAIPSNEEGLIKLYLTDEGDHYLVEVRDNGVGISNEQAEKIFVPYFTTKSTGTGLGLAMSQQIIENMNGKISFKSVVNKETSFFVSLPKHTTS
jgi:two-component system nitrogen regulation sensor histidine kinase NtrY